MVAIKIYLIAFLLIWLLAMIVAYGYGYVGRKMNTRQTFPKVTDPLPPLSIVITAHNQAASLRRHLPVILSQDYDLFEVIVVNAGSTDETNDVLERFELQYANLHHTFTPQSARDISLDRLALTLGFRSAAYEWVVLTRPDCEPVSPFWLTRIGETIVAPQRSAQNKRLKGEPDIIVGQVRYGESRHSWLGQKTAYRRLWADFSNFEHILTGHAAVRADGCNLAYRKQLFIEHQGFAEHLNLKMGAEELLVNYTSTPTNTAVMMATTATIIQEPLPDERTWHKNRIFERDTRSHRRHTFLYNCRQHLRLAIPWLLLALSVAAAIIPFVVDLSSYLSALYIGAIAMGLLLLIYIIVKVRCFNFTAKALGYPSFYLTALILELKMPFWNLADAIGRKKASRNEFRKKFV